MAGDDASRLGEFAWIDDNAGEAGEEFAHEVGLKKRNTWNLHDMHGNVWEWCRDWYKETLPGGTDPEVKETASDRVFRGGSWFFTARRCRSATRICCSPGFRLNDLGFRLAVVLSGL